MQMSLGVFVQQQLHTDCCEICGSVHYEDRPEFGFWLACEWLECPARRVREIELSISRADLVETCTSCGSDASVEVNDFNQRECRFCHDRFETGWGIGPFRQGSIFESSETAKRSWKKANALKRVLRTHKKRHKSLHRILRTMRSTFKEDVHYRDGVFIPDVPSLLHEL